MCPAQIRSWIRPRIAVHNGYGKIAENSASHLFTRRMKFTRIRAITRMPERAIAARAFFGSPGDVCSAATNAHGGRRTGSEVTGAMCPVVAMPRGVFRILHPTS